MSVLSRSLKMKSLAPFVVAVLALPVIASNAQRPAPVAENFRTLATFTHGSYSADPHASPDGRFVLIAAPGELQVYEVATKSSRKLVDGAIEALAWSRTGDRIAFARLAEDGHTSQVWSMPLDPKTANPTGPAQRVSVGQGSQPSISFDGKWISFAAFDSNGVATSHGPRSAHLSVVPVTGGPEKVIAHYKGWFDNAVWSADGKSIYINGTVVGGKTTAVSKLFLDGRAPEVIRPGEAEWFAGMTADRRHLVLVPAKRRVAAGDRASIIDTTGKEIGRVPLPVGAITAYNGVLGDSALLWVAYKDLKRIEIRPTKGGEATRVPIIGDANESPLWSPDGNRIAFQVYENNRVALAVMNADGTGVQVCRAIALRDDPWAASWSPDSKSILFASQDPHQLYLLDVAANRARMVFYDSTARIGIWRWRADGRSINAVMWRDPMQRSSIDEISLSGTQRKLLDVTALPGANGFQFVNDTLIFSRSGTASFVMPLNGGPARKLSDVPAGTGLPLADVSSDRQLVAGRLNDRAHPEVHQIELTSLTSGARRVIEVPFEFTWTEPRFTPDGSALLISGRAPIDSTSSRVYFVPLDGGAPRELARVGNPNGTTISVSPNGASVAYTAQVSHSQSLLLIDLRPALARISLAPTGH
jgi:Tol biopolymer transport system component